MKKLLFLMFIPVLVLTGCNDDDKENGENSTEPTPNQSSFTATFNNEMLSSEINVARELSNGRFMIRTELENSVLKFRFGQFDGNTVYAFDGAVGNEVEYMVITGQDTTVFQNLDGDMIITDYEDSALTFNASFDITLGRVDNPDLTTTLEGTYSNLQVIQIEEPATGQVTAFYEEEEYFNFETSATLFQDGPMEIVLQSLDAGEPRFELFTDTSQQALVTLEGELGNNLFSGNSIFEYNFDHANLTFSCRIKRLSFNDIDTDIWLKNIPVDTINFPSTGAVFVTNSGVELVVGEIALTETINQSTGLAVYELKPAEGQFDPPFFFFSNASNPVEPGLSQAASGVVIQGSYNSISLVNVESTLIAEPGESANTVNVSLTIEGHGVLTGIGIDFIQVE
ncbi:MAG: hypothetical protein AAGC47_01540 [Bacteroidota bacterium]